MAMMGTGPGPHDRAPNLQDYVIVELRHDSGVTHSPRRERFEGGGDAEVHARELNGILAGHRIRRLSSRFGARPGSLRTRATAPMSLRAPVPADFAHAGFVQIVPHRDADVGALADELGQHDAVWKAVPAAHPVPAAQPRMESGLPTGKSRASRNFQPAQGYLYEAPDGIGAVEAWGSAGGAGRGVTICDIEMNWNRAHEALPRGIRLLGGRLYPDDDLRSHGAAVLGMLVSPPKATGTMGACHEATAVVRSFLTSRPGPEEADSGYHHNLAVAITTAAEELSAGDIIQLEVQAALTPGGHDYVAIQYWDDVGSAIRAAVARGICVVEAAANQGVDFDAAPFAGSGLQRDYGAIVVGAGSPPTNHYGAATMLQLPQIQPLGRMGAPRSRMFFSNYGSGIVNLQGWGYNVATLGYGDAQGGGQNRWYTLRFAGTSSATPCVTGAVALVQAYARERHGAPLSPAEVRELLVRTGTPQAPDPEAPVSQHIGPQPNVPAALEALG